MADHTVLIVDTDEFTRRSLRRCLEEEGCFVLEAATGAACSQVLQAHRPDAALVEHNLPDSNALDLLRQLRVIDSNIPVIVTTALGSIELAVRAIKEGAEQFLVKPIEPTLVAAILAEAFTKCCSPPPALLVKTARDRSKADPFLGTSFAIRNLSDAAMRILGSSCPILIEGETGTGKGILALWLHEHGSRAEQPFVNLNCAGLNRELLESELFGHERGAFTGAVLRKTGILEIAHRGTVFLDEIGDMDLTIQPKLLTVLEEKRFRRVGSVRECAIDIHLIAATNRDFNTLVAEHRFREDLYFRVSTIRLRIPPLRERREDITALAEWFRAHLETELGLPGLRIDDQAVYRLQAYDWPGNIRELRNVLERAALVCDCSVIRASDLQFQARMSSQLRVQDVAGLTIEQLERVHIERVLKQVNGKVGEAATRLGLSRSTLYARIKQYGIPHANA